MNRRSFGKALLAGLAGLGFGLSAKEKPPQGEPILHDDRRHFVGRGMHFGYGWGNLDPVIIKQLTHHKGQVVDWDDFAGRQGRAVTCLYVPEYAMTFATLGKKPSCDDPIYIFVGDDRRMVCSDHAWPGYISLEQMIPTYAVTRNEVLSRLLETPVDRKYIYLYKRGDNQWGGFAVSSPIDFSKLPEYVKVGASKTALLWACKNKTITFGDYWSSNIHVSNPRI